jgi:mono/diheme cytochrome c family protein
MKLLRISIPVIAAVAALAGCRPSGPPQLKAAAYGTEITEASGGKQTTQVGSELPQPVVVQVNDKDGNPVTGALVTFRGEQVRFDPAQALTDSGGQVTTNVQLGFEGGNYQITAETPKSGGGSATLTLGEIALGYEQTLGQAVNQKYCIRCHNQESTRERVSNFDNLSPSPHQFTDGETLNRMAESDLTNMITHGGPALGKSAEMPAYGATLKPDEIKAVIAYIRAVADPPYQASGVKYGK